VVVLDPSVGGVAFGRLHSIQGAALARVELVDGDQLTIILRLDPEAVSVIAVPYHHEPSFHRTVPFGPRLPASLRATGPHERPPDGVPPHHSRA
jgi:hypothetical protein